MTKKLSILALILCSFFWGASGVLTQLALKEMSPMMLILIRFTIASIICFILFRNFKLDFKHFFHGIILSILLVVIYISSTLGLKYTSASNAGFIIGSAVVLVPIFDYLIYKTKFTSLEKISIFICFVGLFFVTFNGKLNFNKGDFYCFIDACAYAAYILYNGKKSKTLDTKTLVSIQYTFVSLFSVVYVSLSGNLNFAFSITSWLILIILGVFCTFLAFYLQVSAQKNLSAHFSSKLLTLIPIFSVIFDMIYLKELISASVLLGGILIIGSTFVEELNQRKFKRVLRIKN